LRFERDERHLLLPVAERPYRSLLLMPHGVDGRASNGAPRRAIPQVDVEKRPLSVYAAVAGGL
jgi:hypothetical protein